jgi:uncharacterized protein YndB with AHSA1/START domain
VITAASSILIDRPLDEVFRFVSTDFFRNYPKWSPEVVELEQTSDGPIGVGTTGRQVRLDEGRRFEATFRVTEFEPPRAIAFASTSGPRFRASYRFEPVRERTRVTFTFDLRLEGASRLLNPLVAGLVRKGGRNVVRKLKDLLESNAR